MDDFEGALFMILLLRPNSIYVLPDGSACYVLAANQEGLIKFEGEGLHLMDGDQLNRFIQMKLTSGMN